MRFMFVFITNISLLCTATYLNAQSLPRFAPRQIIIEAHPDALNSIADTQEYMLVTIVKGSELESFLSSRGLRRIDRAYPMERETDLGRATGMDRKFILYFDIDKDIFQEIEELKRSRLIMTVSTRGSI